MPVNAQAGNRQKKKRQNCCQKVFTTNNSALKLLAQMFPAATKYALTKWGRLWLLRMRRWAAAKPLCVYGRCVGARCYAHQQANGLKLAYYKNARKHEIWRLKICKLSWYGCCSWWCLQKRAFCNNCMPPTMARTTSWFNSGFAAFLEK